MAGLRLDGLTWRHVPVMSKDSLDLTDADRRQILAAVRTALATSDAVVVIHGTDTLTVTGEFLHVELRAPADPARPKPGELTRPVILTGAMRPFLFRDTDAFQNVTEALLACRLVAPGVYVVMHNRALRFPGIVKDRATMSFRRVEEGALHSDSGVSTQV